MSDPVTDTCGRRHMLLAAIIVTIVLTVCGATVAYCNSAVEQIRATTATAIGQIDARVRLVEIRQSANTAHYQAIRDAIARIERRLEQGDGT